MTYRREACSNSLRPLPGFCRSGVDVGQSRSNPTCTTEKQQILGNLDQGAKISPDRLMSSGIAIKEVGTIHSLMFERRVPVGLLENAAELLCVCR